MKSISTLFRQLSLIVVLIFAFSLSAWGEEVTETINFSNISGSVQYAEETHKLSDNLTINIKNCHINTQLRIYSSASNNGIVTSNQLPGAIKSMGFNMGYKADNLLVYGSTDGSTWTEIGSITTTTTSYKDYSIVFPENYTYFKLDVKGSNQIRIATMTITYNDPSSEGGGGNEGGTTDPDPDPEQPTQPENPNQETIDFTSGNYKDRELLTNIDGTYIFLEFRENSGTTKPAWYATGTAARLYANNSLTITAKRGYCLASINIVFDNTEDIPTAENSTTTNGTYNYDNHTWTANENENVTEMTLTNTNTRGHFRIQKIIITYKKNTSELPEYMITFGDNEPIETIDGKITKIPTAPTTPCNPTYTTFIGWTKDATFGKTGMEPETIDETTVFYTDTQLYPVYSKETDGGFIWSLVTDASTLAVGDKIVIAAKEYDFALSTTQKDNNRGQAEISKSENTITFGSDVQILTLEAGTTSGTFAFYTGSGYLYAASSGSNYLKTETSLSANSSWAITIADGVATVVAQGSNTRNTMQYNQSSSLFACYGSASQKAIALYKGSIGKVTEYFICCNVVESDKTINIDENITFNTLTIKSNFDEAGEVNVTTGALNANNIVIEKTIDASRWFFFSLPFNCKISDIVATGANGTLTYAPNKTDGEYVITEYNGGWVELIGTSHTLKANQGYIIGHFGSGDVTVKFPSNVAQNISAPANATLAKTSDNGFNLIGLPYFQKVNASLNNINHLSIPNEDGKTYNQTDNLSLLANIAPFTSFFVQTDAENIEFTLGTQQNAAPMLRANGVTNKAVITLTDANGGADKTTIINNPSKTTDYEIGHDLTKLIGYAEIPQIYSLQGDEMLAFNSLAIDNSTVIPLGVYAHTDGDYTFSLSDKSMGNLEGWKLYDSESGKAVALTEESLTVTLSKGTHEGRFSIRMEQGTTTDCECDMSNIVTYMNNGTFYIENMPAKAMVYIYDAVGRMIYATETTDTSFDYTFALRGVYNVVVCTEYNSIAYKTIY